MKVLGIIPARYESTRFPGKPLVEIKGKTMIQRVYEQCQKAKLLTKIVVATDDERIYDHVHQFGGRAMMTSSKHQSGTERCGEVLVNLEDNGEDFDVVVNIQGDEPFIDPSQIDKVCQVFAESGMAEIVTLIKKIETSEELFNPNVVKAIIGEEIYGDYDPPEVIYFSREAIPHIRGIEKSKWLNHHVFYKHIGIYAFKVEELHGILDLDPNLLEKAESLEQLRWITNHYTIQAVKTNIETIGIDTPEDLAKL